MTCAWVLVSSAESKVRIHLRDTKSMMAKQFFARRQRPKWVASQPHTWLGRYSTHSGQGRRSPRGGRGGGLGSSTSWAASTRSTVEGDTHTRPR